jgi:hypothetical protein
VKAFKVISYCRASTRNHMSNTSFVAVSETFVEGVSVPCLMTSCEWLAGVDRPYQPSRVCRKYMCQIVRKQIKLPIVIVSTYHAMR